MRKARARRDIEILCWIFVKKLEMIIEHLLTPLGKFSFWVGYQRQSQKWSLNIYSPLQYLHPGEEEEQQPVQLQQHQEVWMQRKLWFEPCLKREMCKRARVNLAINAKKIIKSCDVMCEASLKKMETWSKVYINEVGCEVLFVVPPSNDDSTLCRHSKFDSNAVYI